MALIEKMHGDVAVIELHGKLIGGPETTEVPEKVDELLSRDIKKVVIDLGRVIEINSTGLGALIGTMAPLRDAGGDLKIARMPEKLETLFVATKLLSIFNCLDTVDEAVAAFRK